MTITLVVQPCSMPESERKARMDRAYDLLWRIFDRVQKKTDSERNNPGRDADSLSAGAIQPKEPDAIRSIADV